MPWRTAAIVAALRSHRNNTGEAAGACAVDDRAAFNIPCANEPAHDGSLMTLISPM
jgi:hypothetical protein